jgi:enoyl-CoA hydratase/carnithine racemase
MINLRTEDGVWTVTIDRPEKANSLTREMLSEIASAAEAAKRDRARVFILRGTGKVFSAGADLEEAQSGLAIDPVWERLSGAIADLPCLTIAALNGSLVGGAMGMALACDLRICAPHAQLFYPVMRLGFLPQPSDPKRMAELIGPSRSKMILMAGAKIAADEALAWGLVDRIVSIEELDPEIEALTMDARRAAADHVASIKALI